MSNTHVLHKRQTCTDLKEHNEKLLPSDITSYRFPVTDTYFRQF